MGRVLILSPHLDDAVLSCPAYIQRLAADGVDVRIATIFTEADAAAASLYRTRRAEDRKAARELDARVIHLGFPDAPFRSPRYRGFHGIVFGRAREYPATCRRVAESLRRLIGRLRPTEVLAPLAVGNHVDHRLVRDAALRVGATLFYEDRPYAFVREQVAHVLGRSLAERPERFWSRYFAAAYVRTYLGGEDPRRIRDAWLDVPAFPGGHRLRRILTVRSAGGELLRTCRALAHHQSQMAGLFEGPGEIRRLYGSVPELLYCARRVPLKM